MLILIGPFWRFKTCVPSLHCYVFPGLELLSNLHRQIFYVQYCLGDKVARPLQGTTKTETGQPLGTHETIVSPTMVLEIFLEIVANPSTRKRFIQKLPYR